MARFRRTNRPLNVARPALKLSWMVIERLSAEDRLMLWPDEMWPQEIGAVAVLEGAKLVDPDGRLRIEAVRDLVAGRLHLLPQFRQLLHVPGRGLGGPLWVDAPSFDLTQHVGVAPLPAPGDEAQLLLAVERLRRRRLDRTRPLWEMWLLPGLPEGRVGLFVRMHHAIADGIAGVAAMGAFLDATPDPVRSPAPGWSPSPAPTPAALRADHIRQRFQSLGRAWSAAAHPVSTVRHMHAGWPAIREVLAEGQIPDTSLDHVVGPDRNLALVRSRIDLVSEIAHRHRGKVNDVLLAVTAAGLRALFSSRGEPVEGVVVRIYVPVTLRQGDRAQARGNQIGQMMVPLPIGLTDPDERLQLIAAETAGRKSKSRPSLGKLPSRGITGRAVLKLINRQKVNVTSADIAGPEIPLYLAGARVLEIFPLLPLIGTVSLGIGALSYAGEFNIMAVADRDAFGDLDQFAEGVRSELRALADAAGITTIDAPTAPQAHEVLARAG